MSPHDDANRQLIDLLQAFLIDPPAPAAPVPLQSGAPRADGPVEETAATSTRPTDT